MALEPATLGVVREGYAAGVPLSPRYDDLYHPAVGAWAQARHVFMAGNRLPERWRGATRFVILETGFGLGNNFLATWDAWLADPQRCAQLVFVSIEKHPLQREDLARVHGLDADGSPVSADDALPPDLRKLSVADRGSRQRLAQRLWQAWPTLTPGLHTLVFDEAATPAGEASAAGQAAVRGVTLMLGLGDIAEVLPALVARADAFYLDGFAPAKNPQMWDTHLLARLNRLAAPEATLATWSCARAVKDALDQAGFQVERVTGFAYKPHMLRAVYAPRHEAALQPGGWWPSPAPVDRHALVVGAGLAGCAAARALCRAGWRVTLVDRHAGEAKEASGNPGGLFHGIVHAQDGIHARAHRAAALRTWQLVAPWIGAGQLRGRIGGLLRLDAKGSAAQAQQALARQGLPPDHVRWVEQEEAQALAGLAVPCGGWLFGQAGWLHPAGLAARMLQDARDGANADEGTHGPLETRWGQTVETLRRHPDGRWGAYRGEALLACAPTVVLCCAQQTPPLLQSLDEAHAVAALPLSPVRGQITALPLGAHAGARLPLLPVAGGGYVLPLDADHLLCGATTQHGDPDPSVREADHRHNLRQAAALGAWAAQPEGAALPAGLQGRTAWRATTPDRLPLVGALPWSPERLAAAATTRRTDQVRLIPRERDTHGGLFIMTGLGSRGITWCALAADLLSHWVTGAPCPVEADLRDALDPARFVVRQAKRSSL